MRDPWWLGKCLCEMADGLSLFSACWWCHSDVLFLRSYRGADFGWELCQLKDAGVIQFNCFIRERNKQDIGGRDKRERGNGRRLKVRKKLFIFEFATEFFTDCVYFSLFACRIKQSCILVMYNFLIKLNVSLAFWIYRFGSNYCALNICFYSPQVDA